MPHGKPITISRVEHTKPTAIKRRDVRAGQVFSHNTTNSDDNDLYIAADASICPLINRKAISDGQSLLCVQISTGRAMHTGDNADVYLRDAELAVGGAK